MPWVHTSPDRSLSGAGRSTSPELHKAPEPRFLLTPPTHKHAIRLLALGHAPSGELSVAKALGVREQQLPISEGREGRNSHAVSLVTSKHLGG